MRILVLIIADIKLHPLRFLHNTLKIKDKNFRKVDLDLLESW